MGAPYANIQRALDLHLAAFATAQGLAVRLENSKAFDPPDAMWLWPTVIPADNRVKTLSNKLAHVTGLYQVNVFCPEQSGSAAINQKVDLLLNYFAVGTTLTYGGDIVKVHSTERKQGRPDENDAGFFMVPAIIHWKVWAEP